uniref:Zinc finger FYVE domain-containing protein 26 n=1 Tax=Gouania willdenowi TaxID=441366 RepID=A0A8C5G0J9_GOUWI
IMYPFGCDPETSLQELFKYFKRCVQRGEWQLASACVPQLLNSAGGLSEDLREIIKAIVCHPYFLKYVTCKPCQDHRWFLTFCIFPSVELPESEKLTLSLCCHKDRPFIWKNIYFECLSSGKHFLEQVLVTALDLVKHEEFVRLKELLQLEFKPLSRLVLLLGWNQCRSLSAAQTLLQILHKEQVIHKTTGEIHLLLLRVCRGVSMEALLAQLLTLDNHTALYMLHSLTPLAQFEESRVLELLQKVPNLPETDVNGAVSLNPAAQRNIVLFQGFCSLKYAIYALCVNAHKYLNCTECNYTQQDPSSEAENDQDKTSVSSEDYHLLFQHYLTECQLYLEALPTMFRLELLENIFSLLFLSTTDFLHQSPKDKSSNPSRENSSQSVYFSDIKSKSTESETKAHQDYHKQRSGLPRAWHLNLEHYIQGCRGFLVDVTAMEGFLKLLKEGLEGMCVVGQQDGEDAGRALPREAEVAASLGCSITAETFGHRLQRLSKYTAEAQWRLQIITRNYIIGNGELQQSACAVTSSGTNRSSSLRKKRKTGRQSSSEKNSSASCVEQEFCECDSPHNWLVPAMLSPPESLLMSCIRRGNFMEAHQVTAVFDLASSDCSGELAFMERYNEVLMELGQVEQKMEKQSIRLGSSGRSTLQAIGSAAAAGVAFYTISDIADRLLSTPAHPLPSLENGYWLSLCPSDASSLLCMLLEELSPAAMAAFDLACCHCQLWKTSRQLLDMAERRLSSSLEERGMNVDTKLPHPEGICGFPMVLQQINKILNHSATHKTSDPVFASPFGCCIQDVLLCCHPTLTEECIAAHLRLTQRLETTLHLLSTANDEGTVGSALLALLVEQASLKQSDLDAHPVRSSMKQLLRSLDQLCPFEPDGNLARPDYVRSFFDYINTLASVLVLSLNSEDQIAQVKLGNPLLVLLQTPFQLLFHLLFDRQVSPDRVLSLLQREGLRISIQQVIVQRCCESLPVQTYSSGKEREKKDDGPFSVAMLAFLKSRSPLLATLACLSASKRETVRLQSTGWSGYFRSGRKEVVLDDEQISLEVDNLLKRFSILGAYLQTMAEPVLGTKLSESEDSCGGLGAVICGKPLVSLLFSGPQDELAKAVAAEAFQKALLTKDLNRALRLLELYGQGCKQEEALRDRLLACAALEGIGHLFRVQDANMRASVALQGLERWRLSACLELLEFCLSDTNTDASLKTELEIKKKELDIYCWSQTNSESMLHRILETKEFALCAQWVELHPVSEQLNVKLQTEHLLYLLEKGQTDQALQLLESLSDVAVGIDVCESALDQRPGLPACYFLADYLTLHFQRQVSPVRQQHIHALHLGSKVLLTLPLEARQEYFPLLSEPMLMLEQLLMNLKVDWADMAVQSLRKLVVGQEAGFSSEDIDKLLTVYAGKALDFSCAPSNRSRSDSVISLHDALMQCSTQDNISISSSRRESPVPSTSETVSSDRERDQGISERKRHSPSKFQPPDRPPARKDWVPDTQQAVCMVCRRERFTMFNRRHHCRRCGRLVCHTCSERKMLVDGCPGEEVRVCDQCYSYFHPDFCICVDGIADSDVTDDALHDLLHLPEVFHRQIKLSTNPSENQQQRSEFYYEQAPSAYLCVSILSLHSDQTACGHQLISHCRSLSCKLTNREVDACLLTDIMHQLLFSAKLMFVKVGRNQDLALCDSYISKVDVLKILVKANYKYIPSLDEILETSAVTRLRNQLLESEYYQLAVEVSTKSSSDPGGVWQAWAMASLKAGNLTGAREMFARCLKTPLDRNQMSLGPLLLQEIVQHLENTVRPTLSSGEDILASLRELEEALTETTPPPERAEGPTLSNYLHQECLYYLNMYGTHLALISFYMLHDCVTEAGVLSLLSQECSEEIFLEAVLQPSLERGHLSMLQGILEKLDPGLETCSRYLIASCQFLQRRGYYHSLYQLQQFMTDHVRAAMTCIRFFTHGAPSYLQLGEQTRWLVRAKEHLRTYLQELQGRGGVRRKASATPFRKMMSSSDISRHMNTIELQLEVTRFLHHCENASPSKVQQNNTALSTPSGSISPPTLFGGNAMKAEVACKVMLGGKNVEEGFGIAYRVIQDFQLEAQAVYMRAGQRLVRRQQYKAVRQLLKCVSESGSATKNDCDTLILNCARELESLILEIKSSEIKIKAFLVCGKLRPAYLLAVKLELSRAHPLVQEVLQTAEAAQDVVMQNICRQWLSEHNSKSSQSRQGRSNAR